jgi:hypothetical protein
MLARMPGWVLLILPSAIPTGMRNHEVAASAGVEVDKPVIACCRQGDRVSESVADILDAGGRPLAWLGSHAMPCRVHVTETVTHAVRQRATGRNLPRRAPRSREGASL